MEIGDVLDGKYRIEHELGRGSFGAVYKAVQINIDREVAVKVLKPKGRVDEEMRRRFKREAKLSSHLNSPHTIKIHDFGQTDDDRWFIVMELLDGQPLDSLVRKEGPLPPARVAKIIKQTLQSLGEAHSAGIIHRDLKPDNIFICSKPEPDFVKVFDFGIAKVVGGSSSGSLKETAKLTMVGGTVGTPAYMSPEQCCGEDLKPSSDFYSLGIVMYEMLTGILPFEDTNPVRTMMRQINEMPDPLPPELAETPVGLATFKALAKKSDDRFQDAQEFIDALAEPEPSIPVSAVSRPPEMDFGDPLDRAETERVLPTMQPPNNPSQIIAQGGHGRTSLLWGVVIGAIAVVVLLAVLLVVLFALKGG